MANVLHAYFGLKKKEQDFKKNKEMECDNLITTVTVVHLPGSSHKYSTDDSESHFLKKKIKLTAGHIKERAVNGGDPEVRGACVEQHSEVLWRAANADLPIVLGLRRQKNKTLRSSI